MDMILGSALKYGDDINTDIISPPQYMELPIAEASAYAMQAVDPDFAKRVKKGGLLRCGEKPRLRFEPRDFAADVQIPRCFLRDRRVVRPHLLPQLHQCRHSGAVLRGGVPDP